jgi:hypothetical protein
MAACRGRYIAFCEGDDVWLDPHKLQRQVDLLERRADISLACHAAIRIDSATGRHVGGVRPAFSSRILAAEEVILGDGGLIPTASLFARREVVTSLPKYFFTSPVGDYPFVLHALSSGAIAYIDEPMSVYRINVEGSWTQRYVATLSARAEHARRIEAMLRGFNATQGNRYTVQVQRVISKYYSDVLTRIEGTAAERQALYREFKQKLVGSDRVFSALAIRAGMRLPAFKTAVRKLASSSRQVRCMLSNEKLSNTNTINTGE